MDLGKYLSWLTFDVLGEVGFGRSFETLKSATNHQLVDLLFILPQAGVLVASLRDFTVLKPLLLFAIPRDIFSKSKLLWTFCQEMIKVRLDGKAHDRKDIMSFFEGDDERPGLSVPELEANGFLLMFAGAETSGSVLSAAVSYIARDKARLKVLRQEIDVHFDDMASVNPRTCATLPYLHAVLQETLRLAPPVPSPLPHIIPASGVLVCGEMLTANVSHMQWRKWNDR